MDGILQNLPNTNFSGRTINVAKGKHLLSAFAYGYRKKEISFSVVKPVTIELRLMRCQSLFSFVGIVPTGNKPKSVAYFPDGKCFAAALLDGYGVEVFDSLTLEKVAQLSPPKIFSNKKGFVEVLCNPKYNEIWFSQMSTGYVHIFDMVNFKYKNSLSTQGNWSKILCLSNDNEYAAVSNWNSEDISIFSVSEKILIKKILVEGIPRGMVFSNDDDFLYVCIFSDGCVLKINVKNGKTEKLNIPSGAKRYIVYDAFKQRFYVSDMGRGSILIIDSVSDKIIKEIKVDKNLNTIVLSAKAKFLLVSARGPKQSFCLFLHVVQIIVNRIC